MIKYPWEKTYEEMVEEAQQTFASKEDVRGTLLGMLEVNKDRMRRQSMSSDSPFAYQNLAIALACHYLEQEVQEDRYPLQKMTTTNEDVENLLAPLRALFHG